MTWDKKLLLMALALVAVGVLSAYILMDITGLVLLLFFAFVTMDMRRQYVAELKELAADEDDI